MELIERLPLREINFLNDMDMKTFRSFTENCKNEDERKEKFNMMKTYCKNAIKTKGEITKCYSFTERTPNEVGGRLYCGHSIQSLPKDIRGLILRNVSTDVDMKNAHPVILQYICQLNGIACPNLSWYVSHRDEVLMNFGADGKTAFLKAVNDDKINKKVSNQFFKDFDKECKKLQKEITALPCYKHIVDTVPFDKTYNRYGSAINRILCVFENRILQEVIHIVRQKQIDICALMFDGLMMYGNHYDDNEILKDITDYVNSQFAGLNMVFTYKEHSQVIQIPEDYDITVTDFEPVTISVGKSFNEVAAEFEKTHCKIVNKAFFIKEETNKNVMMTKSHLITSYETMVYDKLNVTGFSSYITTENFINDWLRNNPEQRCYNDIDCFPDKDECPDNIFNTWKPFAMELVTEYEENLDALAMMRNLIKILCGNDDAVATYLEAWIAQMIQFPATKTICPTLISKQGAGKGTLMTLLSAMIGRSRYVETTNPSRDIWGDFNGRMADTFLVNLDELSRKESMDSEGKIKALITNPYMTINNKGVNQYDIKSFHRFIATTNNEEPIKTTKDDRRNLIISSSNELIGNKDYFNKCYEYLNDVNVIKTCYEYFKSIDGMKDFNKIPMPETEYQNDMKDASVSPIENWIKSFILDNYYEISVELLGKTQYDLFKEWSNKCGIDYNVTLQAFGLRMKRLNIIGIEKGKHTNKGETKIFKIIQLRNHFKMNDIVMDISENIE